MRALRLPCRAGRGCSDFCGRFTEEALLGGRMAAVLLPGPVIPDPRKVIGEGGYLCVGAYPVCLFLVRSLS